MIDAFTQFIQERHLCSPANKILVAVSGGVDSVVLLDLFVRSGYSIAIAHCNFKLRGNESDQDERFVASLAKNYKLDFYKRSFNTKEYASENKCSIQEAARDLRYQWFDELCEKHGFERVAVGQHLDDQLETFFINLFRGSGVTGLKGMPLQRDRIIRPLLFARRKEIVLYKEQNTLQFREDSSNRSDKYLRNRIRHKILPEINEVKDSNELAILKSLGNLYEDDLVLNILLEEKRRNLFRQIENGWEVSITQLKLNQPLTVMMYYLLKEFGFSRDITDQITDSLIDIHPGKIFQSPTHQLLIDRDRIFIQEKREDVDKVYFIHEDDEEINKPVELRIIKKQYNSSFVFNKEHSFAYFDFDRLTFPLKIRKWKLGDRFVPYGMKGSKLVSDYLIDSKVNRFEKENVFVLLSDDVVIWLIGLRSSSIFKVTTETKQLYYIKQV